MTGPANSSPDQAPAARVLFESVEAAHLHSPYFIDEDGIGIWLSTDRDDLPPQLPVVHLARDAVHIPSVDQNGRPLAGGLIDSFLAAARQIGLTGKHAARGYWTLSSTGALQIETVWIVFSPDPVDPDRLHALVNDIYTRGNQDAVAYEIRGTVQVFQGL